MCVCGGGGLSAYVQAQHEQALAAASTAHADALASAEAAYRAKIRSLQSTHEEDMRQVQAWDTAVIEVRRHMRAKVYKPHSA